MSVYVDAVNVFGGRGGEEKRNTTKSNIKLKKRLQVNTSWN
jgi:hypothetical protein